VKGQDPKIVGARTVASRNREKDKQAPDLQGGEWDAKDPRVIDLDTKELRKRRDEATKPDSAPAMNTVP
jgi:hypothetical protein